MATSREFFSDLNEKIIKDNLLTETAQNYVNEFKKNDTKNDGKEIKNAPSLTQVRKFYNEVLTFKQKIETGASTFKKELPYIKMLKAKAQYAYNRKNVNSKFVNFINKNIDEIKDYDDFKVFCDLFESIIAYSVGELKK